MATVSDWLSGARPRTLPAAVVPVVVGTAVAKATGHINWLNAILALVVSLSMQVGTNFANDYSDGIRGTDKDRVGPRRLVAGGVASPRLVKIAAIAAFSVGALAGLALSTRVSPILLVVGAASIAAGWLYTGGPKPYGYAGLGELFVFVFFGLVAVVGTSYVAAGHVNALAFAAAVPVGLLAVALLVVNNLRDISTDEVSGKHTLAVRLGPGKTRIFYATCIVGALVVGATLGVDRPWAVLTLLGIPLGLRVVAKVLRGANGHDLVAVLGATGMLQLVIGALIALGLSL